MLGGNWNERIYDRLKIFRFYLLSSVNFTGKNKGKFDTIVCVKHLLDPVGGRQPRWRRTATWVVLNRFEYHSSVICFLSGIIYLTISICVSLFNATVSREFGWRNSGNMVDLNPFTRGSPNCYKNGAGGLCSSLMQYFMCATWKYLNYCSKLCALHFLNYCSKVCAFALFEYNYSGKINGALR